MPVGKALDGKIPKLQEEIHLLIFKVPSHLSLLLVTHTVHEITAGHRSPSDTISCVTGRIRFLSVTMTDRFSNFNSISYTNDRHELRVTGTKCRLPDTMSGTSKIFISGADGPS